MPFSRRVTITSAPPFLERRPSRPEACCEVAMGIAIALLSASTSGAQRGPLLPPVRQLGPRLAVSTDSLGTIRGIRQLSDGRVFVNDVSRRRLLLYDSTLSHAIVVADSTPSTNKAYGRSGGGIIPFVGDSTIFVDPASISFLVLDPSGKIVRVVAPPSDPAAMQTLPGMSGAFDAKGDLIYLTAPRRPAAPGLPVPDTSAGLAVVRVDSGIVARANMATRAVDTAGFVVVGANPQVRTVAPSGDKPAYNLQTVNPMILFDWWAVTSDGSVAIVRGLDYHIDWINPDGTSSSTPRMAHDWKRLTDSAKQAIIDSVRQRNDSLQHARDRADSMSNANGKKPSSGEPAPMRTVLQYVQAADLPDYTPPFVALGIMADAENCIWIREGASYAMDPPAIYDIVDRRGVVFDRVQLPPGLLIAGFGRGVVYLTSKESYGMAVVKYRIK